MTDANDVSPTLLLLDSVQEAIRRWRLVDDTPIPQWLRWELTTAHEIHERWKREHQTGQPAND